MPQNFNFFSYRAIQLREQKLTLKRSPPKKSEEERIYAAKLSRQRYRERKKFVYNCISRQSSFKLYSLLNSDLADLNSITLTTPELPEEPNMDLVLRKLTSQILITNGWLPCSCSTNCSCSTPPLPKWSVKYGKVHQLLKCFDVSGEDFIYTDDFIFGIQSSRSLSVRGDKGKKVLERIILGYRKDLFSSSLADQEELDIASGIGKKGVRLRDHASGFACGNVLSDMFTRWNYLRMHCRTEESRFEELRLWTEELSNNVKRLENAQKWLSLEDSKRSQPLQYEIWSGTMFWYLQHAFYLISDLQILTEMRIEEAFSHFDAGLLLWQIGWLQTDNQVCDEVSKIMFMDSGPAEI
jgi:hypothetical protein